MKQENLIEQLILQAIAEDIGEGDHTSLATIPAEAKGRMRLLVKEKGVVAGVDIARQVFQLVDSQTKFFPLMKDGEAIQSGDIVFEVEGSIVSLLSAERLALNFLQRMSGIATQTAKLVALVSEFPVKLLDTRKTTPNMRPFEKMAVKIGGGENHRFGLYDMILIKNNHVDFAGGVHQAIEAAHDYLKKIGKSIPVEIEVRNFSELNEALETGKIQRIMLDNFSPADLSEALKIINKRYETEASGGIDENTLYDYAATGVDFISVGALTHHIQSIDLSLRAITE